MQCYGTVNYHKVSIFHGKWEKEGAGLTLLGSRQPGRKGGSAPALVEVKQANCFNFMVRQGLQEVSWKSTLLASVLSILLLKRAPGPH